MSYLEDLKNHYKEVRKRMEKHAIPEPRPVMFLPPRMLKLEAGTPKPGLVSEKDEKEIVCKALRITSIDDLDHHSQVYRMADELLNSPRLPPLPGLVISETGKIRWMRILHHVAKQHGLEPSDILSESRKRHIINARFEVFYRLRIDLAMSYTKIAILFGKDHSTIVHGVSKIRHKLLDEAKRLAEDKRPSLVATSSQSGHTPDNLLAD